ncbi:MAG: glutathione S-transferase family protein [Deltaproteobacteria bacterium]|nr:glutathione S-transferase family protein [Deltaproteobacteria bacterium]
MKLYVNPMSPNCRRVAAVVYHTNAKVEFQTIDFGGKFDWDAFKKVNPTGLIPALEDGDFKLGESNAIMQYLADQTKSDLLGTDARSRADVTRWQCWQLAHFGPASDTLLWENMLKGMFGEGEANLDEVKQGLEEFRQHAAVLDKHLSSNKFIGGTHVTLADYSIAANLMYAEPAKLPLLEFPHIKKWYANIETLDAWKKSTPPRA